ncbi:hypothetical protein TWF281_006172 [Arthrobotrys megalospora]
MFWIKLFILFLFFAQNLVGGISQSTESADIPRNVRVSIPSGFTSFQISTTSSSVPSSSSSSDPTTSVTRGIDTPAPTTSEPPRDPTAKPGSKPLGIGTIAGIAVGAAILLLGTTIGAIWYSRSKHRSNNKIKSFAFEDQPNGIPPQESVSKESPPIQESQAVEPEPTPAAAKDDHPSRRNQRRLRSSVGGL